MNNFLFLLVIVLSLSGCSSSKNVNAVHFKHFDFSQVKTYSTYDRNSGFRTKQNITDIKRNQIELAIDKSMQVLGFSYVGISTSDIIVSYELVGRNRADYVAYNKAVKFCFSCTKSSRWESEDENWDVQLGSLVIDLIDPRNNRSVWRNIYPLELEVDDNSSKVNIKINEAVEALMSKYPVIKGSTLN